MRRFRRRGFGRRKRSVNWIPGYTSMDPVNGTFVKTIVMTALAGSANTWAAGIQLTLDTDLTMHGGEDAVLARVRGEFMAIQGERNAGAGFAANSFLVRAVIAAIDQPQAGTFSPFPYVDSQTLGADNIMWIRDFIVPSTALGATGTGLDATEFGNGGRYLDVDVRAKRRLQSDRHVFLIFQTVVPAGTTALQFKILGHLRLLLMRPR